MIDVYKRQVVTLAGAVGVLDDDIHKELGHQFLPFHFGKAVPAVRVFREHQIEHLDTVASVSYTHLDVYKRQP